MAKVIHFYDYVDVTPKGVTVPSDIGEKVKFIDSLIGSGQGLLVKTVAQHAAYKIRNNAMYLPSKVQKGKGTMLSVARGGTAGFDKPVLVNHDDGAPGFLTAAGPGKILGRAVANRYVPYDVKPAQSTDSLKTSLSMLCDHKKEKPMWSYMDLIDELNAIQLFDSPEWRGAGHLEVDALITDPDAIAQILDGRYLTVSTGMTSDRAICSEKDCHQDWVTDGPCDHSPGKNGMFLVAGELNYEEAYSYVVNPADGNATVIDYKVIDLPQANIFVNRQDNLKPNVYELRVKFVDSVNFKDEEADQVQFLDKETPSTEPKTTLEDVTKFLASKDAKEVIDVILPLFIDSDSLKKIHSHVTSVASSLDIKLPLPEVTQGQLGDLTTKVDSLTRVNTELEEAKKFLRLELKDFYATNDSLTKERDNASKRLHDILVEYTTILKMISSKEGDFDSLKALQGEKTILQLETEFNELRDNVNFGKMILRPDNTSGNAVKAALDDPTLPGAGIGSEPVKVEDKLARERKKYGQYVERYAYLSRLSGKADAQAYIRDMKLSGFLPKDFKVEDHITNN